MVNLVIDIGNTLTKLAIFRNRAVSDRQIFEKLDGGTLQQYMSEKEIEYAIISSVDKEISDLEYVVESYCRYIRFNTTLSVRVKNHYKTPQTLGLDRYAAVIAAETIFPAKNCLVIDAGTCITYDFIDSNKNYYGGSIAPGIEMRFQSMHAFTGRLPLVQSDEDFTEKYGTDTRSSILSGVQNGAWNEVFGFIQSYSFQYPDLQIILCGGDVKFFDTRLKNSIFASSVKIEPDLVLIGLNEVIYQQQ